MALPELLEGIRRRPGMYLRSTSFDTVVAFLDGYDAALAGGLLVGFREWLIVKARDGDNLSWAGLVWMLCRGDEGSEPPDEVARETLFRLLAEFLARREDREGLKQIYLSYEAWLRRQRWYVPEKITARGRGARR